ncbi:protein Mis18-alpha isoform X1 [Camelus bactrianus]|uniref:Protein Mis18-alpha n=1 Tax=Camelus bactrianus TaxID=9837 RepID=A0A9W3G8A1_CAMBA|nr:protein Mis18-alpha isoform X1 [Camelus dromedarius]XP_045373792.1 protein Mis18-alpha isoform X1 [Camelus bactrianus]
MAGAWFPGCCKGCSSASCACGDKGKWSDSSLLGKRLSEDSGRHQLLQKWASMWSSVSGDASVACTERTQREEAAEPAEEEDRPLVFLCSRCRRPLGDSLSWVTSQEDTNCILLRSVSCNVSVDKEQILSKRQNENGCCCFADAVAFLCCSILEPLYCAGCSLSLGYVYRCTPEDLDYKRDLFCLSVEAIESYVLGSSEKQIVSEDKELFNLESRVEIEKSLKQMEDVLKALQTKLWEAESKLSFTSCKS